MRTSGPFSLSFPCRPHITGQQRHPASRDAILLSRRKFLLAEIRVGNLPGAGFIYDVVCVVLSGFVHHGDRGHLGAVVGGEWHQRLRTGDFGRKLEGQGRLEGSDVSVAVPGLPQTGGIQRTAAGNSLPPQTPTFFGARFRLPFELLSRFFLQVRPAEGTLFLGNL